MGKWIIAAMEPDESGLKVLLRACLLSLKPHNKSASWYPSREWTLSHHVSSTQGSRLWNRTSMAWKKLVLATEPVAPQSAEEVLNTNLWWASKFIGGNFRFTMDRAREIARSGLATDRQLWNDETAELRSWEELVTQFQLDSHEQHFYRAWSRNSSP